MFKEKEVLINPDDLPQIYDDVESDYDDVESDDDNEENEFLSPIEEIIFLTRDNVNYVLDQLGGFKIDEEEWSSLCWHQMGDISALAYELIFTELSDELVFDALFCTIIEKQLESHCG